MNRRPQHLVWTLVLVLTAVLVIRAFAEGKEQDPPPEPQKDIALAVVDLQNRVTRLERLLGLTQEGEAEALKQLQSTVENAERELALTDKALDLNTDAVKALEETNKALTQRIEQLDRNSMNQMKRELDDLERTVDDLIKRVRRLE